MTVMGPAGVLTLGTAQFGQAYGVANRAGAVSETAAIELVAAAWEDGIREFDTAAGYGDSESVLGRALSALGLADVATVITKVHHLSVDELADQVTATARITASVERSRQRLGLDRLPVVLFHRDEDARYLDVLLELQGRGWIDRVGVSVGHDPEPARRLAGMPGVRTLQVPASALDQRHVAGGVFDAALQHGVRVYVRSVYLQGLLVMPVETIPAHLADALPARRALAQVAADAGLSLAELALRAMLSLPGDVSLLVGAETVEQIHQNCTLAAAGELPPEVLSRLADVPRPPEAILTPMTWPGLASTHQDR